MIRTIDKLKAWFALFFSKDSIKPFVKKFGDLRKTQTWVKASRSAMFWINKDMRGLSLKAMQASCQLSEIFGCLWEFYNV